MANISLTNDDVDLLARIAGAEAGSLHGPEGRNAVMAVVLNRVASPDFPNSVREVIAQKNQFEPVTRYGGLERLPQVKETRKLEAHRFLSEYNDPTSGALYFLNPSITEQRGTSFASVRQTSPTLRMGKGGNQHWFYRNIDESRPNRRADQYSVSIGDFTSMNGLGAPDPVLNAPQEVFHSTEERDRVRAGGLPDDAFQMELEDIDGPRKADDPDIFGDNLAASMATVQMFANMGAPEPDPDWVMTEDTYKEMLDAGYPEETVFKMGREAHSADHLKWLQQRYREEAERDERIAQDGWTGFGIQLFGSIVDPLNWIPGVGLAGAAGKFSANGVNLLARSTRTGQALQTGAIAGAWAGAYEEVLRQNRPTVELDQVLAVSGVSMGMGLALGAIAGPTAPAVSRLARSMQSSTSLSTPGSRSVGAAQNVMPFSTSATTEDLMKMAETLNTDTAFMSNKFVRNIRSLGGFLDVVAQGKHSKNPLSRMGFSVFGEDAVGQTSGATPLGATEYAGRVKRVVGTEFWKGIKPAWEAYAKDQGFTVFKPRELIREKRKFGRMVRDHAWLDGADPSYSNSNPHVAAAAETWRNVQMKLRDWAEQPGLAIGDDSGKYRSVHWFDKIPPDTNYVPLYVSDFKVNQALRQLGKDGLTKHVFEAQVMSHPTMSREAAKVWSRLYVETISSLKYNFQNRARGLFDGSSPDKIDDVLRELREDGIINITDAEIKTVADDVMARTRKYGEDGEGFARTRKRGLKFSGYSAETSARWVHPEDGETAFRIMDLFEDDIVDIGERYVNEMGGRIGLALARVQDDAGEVLLDGITSDREFKRLVEQIKKGWQELENTGKATHEEAVTLAERETKHLEWLYRQALGLPEEADYTRFAEALKLMRAYQFLRVMGQVGFSQLPEMANIFAQTGVINAVKGMPMLNSILRDARSGQLKKGWMEELERTFGYGAERYRGDAHSRYAEWSNNPQSLTSNPKWRAVDNTLRKGQQIMADVSLMAPINVYLHRWAMNGMMFQWVKQARKVVAKNGDVTALRKGEIRRLEAMGISREMAPRVFKQIEKHVKVGDRLDLDAWTDAEARAHFLTASDRLMRRIIQQNDPGAFAPWMSGPLARTILQFRTFMLGSWSKQFLYNLHMRDFGTFVQFSGATVAAALTHIGQTHLRASMRSDRKEYLERNLSYEAIGLASLQRGGWFPMFAFAADMGNVATGGDPIFGYRGTGLSSAIDSPSSAFIFKDLPAAAKALRGYDGHVSQSEIRDITRLLAAQNTIPFMMLQHILTQDLPKK